MNRIYLRFAIVFFAMFAINCGGSGFGCGGCASSCGGNPNYKYKGKVTPNAITTRLTQGGADFISAQLKPILEQVLKKAGQSLSCSGKGIVFPAQSFGNGPIVGGKRVAPSANNCTTKLANPLKGKGFVTCTGHSPSTSWFQATLKGSSACGQFATQSIKLKLNESDQSITIDFAIPEIRVRSQQPSLGFCGKGKISRAGDACGYVDAGLKSIEMVLSNLSGSIKMKFAVDPKTGKISLKIPSNGITFSNNTKFKINMGGCRNLSITAYKGLKLKLPSGICTTILKGLSGLINGIGSISLLRNLIYGVLTRVITDQLKNVDLLGSAKVEMELPLANILGGLGLPGLGKAKPLGLLMQPGNAVRIVKGGLNLPFDTGFESNPPSVCVPQRPEPLGKPSSMPPLGGTYHMAAALSKAATDKALWGVYHSGILCLKIKSSDLGNLGGFALNAGVFALLAPNLTKIVPEDAPVIIAIQPNKAPTATYGTGKKVNGKTDSTVKLHMRDFAVSFFVRAHDRYVRIFKMFVDLKLGVTMIATPNNSLEVAVDIDTLEINNPRSSQAYLVKIVDIKQLLKVVVNLLVQTLGNNKISFPIDINKQLSTALGVPLGLKINGIEREGAGNDWLALKMTLFTGSKPLLPEPRTYARIHAANPGLTKKVNGRLLPTGHVFVEVPEYLAGRELEYQYYVNYGAWSNFQAAPGGLLRVHSPILMLLGHHKIYLRARIKGEYKTLESRPAVVKFLFDPLAPKVGLKVVGNSLQIKAADQVSPSKKLIYEYLSNGEWKTVHGTSLKLSLSLKNQHSIAIRVQDAAGNARIVRWSPSSKTIISQQEQTSSNSSTPRAFGCSVGPTGADTVPWWLMLIFFFPFLRRRLQK